MQSQGRTRPLSREPAKKQLFRGTILYSFSALCLVLFHKRSVVGASCVVVGVQLGGANAEQSLAAKFLVSGADTSTRCHEAQMLLAAKSPHILRCHGLFEAELDQSPKMRGTFGTIMVSHKKKAKVESMNRFVFLLTDRCDCSLYSLAQAASFKESEASFAIHSALRGLEHLHALGMVHRDVKDANIMVQDAGCRVVLADFDLAAYLPKGAETTKWTCGTPGFLAPEVYSKAEAGSKADIFSLGVVLYYLLTQSHAFLRDSPLETEIATKSSRLPVDADLLRVFRSEDACGVVFWLLEPLAEDRASASEALESEWFFFQDSGGLSRLMHQKLPKNSLLQRSDPNSSTRESSSVMVSKRTSLPVPGAKHKKVKKAFLEPSVSRERSPSSGMFKTLSSSARRAMLTATSALTALVGNSKAKQAKVHQDPEFDSIFVP